MAIPTDRRPIGFWLKLLDELIGQRLEQTLGGISRREWQVLNSVQQGAASQAEVDDRVRPFLGQGASTAGEVESLRGRGWVAREGAIALTERGAKELERLLSAVSADRAALMEGVSADEYASTVSTLEHMASNLGWSTKPSK